tara:strand:+ start:3447 stop:3854 length:408 start_codon:yes stop_codon:yes gene_type:complete
MAEMRLTDQEQNIVKYHRDTIASGNVGSDENGRPVTVYATGIQVMEGPYKGKFVSVPGYVKGSTKHSEDYLYDYWKEEINSGKWPMYNSGEELNKRSQEIHTIMDDEEKPALESRAKAMPPRLEKRQLLKDAEMQ